MAKDDVLEIDGKATPWKDAVSLEEVTSNINEMGGLYKIYVDKVERYRNALDANYNLPKIAGRSQVRPKSIRKLHNYAYAALSENLLSDYDVVSTTPVGSEDHDSANAQKLLINHQINEEMDFEAVADKAARYFEDYGSFYLKLSWNYKERKKKSYESAFRGLPQGVTEEQLQQLAEQDLLTDDGLLKVPKEVTKVVNDHPVISLKKYNQIILGASTDGSNDIDSLQFIADKYYSTINALEATGKYENLDKIWHRDTKSDYDVNALPDADFDEAFKEMLEDTKPEDVKSVDRSKPLVVTEYWTKVDVGNNVIGTVVVTFVAGVIIGKERSPFGDDVGYPFARGVYSPSLDDDLYDGEPDTLDLEEDQKIIGAVTRGLIDIMGKSANGQTGMAEGMLDPAEEIKRQQGKDYKFNPAIDPTRGIVQEKFPELPNSGLQMLSIMQNSMESSSGKKMFGEGLNSNAYGDVAAGVKATVDATVQRTIGSIRKFNKPFVAIFKKLSQVNKEFITDDKIIALSDKTFMTIRNDDLQTDVNIKISISTPELDDLKANDLAFMVQTLGESVDHKTKQILMADIATLKKRPDLAKALREVPEPQPSPQDLQLHDLQVELLKAQIANEYSKASENDSDAGLNEAKTDTEVAKTALLMSNKDNQDLDFIQKRGGVAEKRNAEAENQKHTNSMESAALGAALNSTQGEEGKKKTKVPKNPYTKDSDVPVIDFPQESLQASDINR